jgi:signal transduction histidine kinase
MDRSSMKRLRTRNTSLRLLVGGLYLLGILLPGGVLGAILVTSLERERSLKIEKRRLERIDAGEAVNEAVEREIARLRRRRADPEGAAGDWLRSFWNPEAPEAGLVRLRGEAILPFDARAGSGSAVVDDGLVLGSAEYLAGLQAEQQGDRAAAVARYRRALATKPEQPEVIRIALGRVLLAEEKVASAIEVLEGAGLDRDALSTAVAVHGATLLASALARAGHAERADAARRAARARLDEDRAGLGFLAYLALREKLRAEGRDSGPLRRLEHLYRTIAANENRSRLLDGESLVWHPAGGPPTLLAAGPEIPDGFGGRPLRMATCAAVLEAARKTELDSYLERRRFRLADAAPGVESIEIEVPALERTFRLEDRAPVGRSLWEEDEARTLLLIGGLAYAGLVLGFLLVGWAVGKQIRLARLRADFISSVSHELKTPLTSLLLFSDLLRSGTVTDPGKVRQYHDFIGEESGKLAHLVSNILDFARIDAGRKTYRRERFDLGALVRATAEAFAARAEAAGTSIDTSGVNGALTVEADRDALERVVANLLDNAVKYGRDGGSIEISAEREDGLIRLKVADRGPGIPAGERGRLFRRFERGEHHGSDAPPGSGLGLAIVAELVTAHEGRVTIEETPGGGATFVVELPVGEG